jgi:hypothetical protein
MGENKIQIILEGDATQLTSTLKRATDTVIQSVNKMNSQRMDWDTIMAKTISPTIISAVAATFANAIAQYTNFQNAALNLNNVGGSATNEFANSITQAGGAAYTLADQAGRSLGDTTQAYNAFVKAGLSGAAATDAVTQASNLAYATGEDFTKVVQSLVALFNQWGVQTTPQVEEALTGLANAAHNGSFSFDELVSSIGNEGPLLKGKTNISDIAGSLASLSVNSGLSKTTILQTFDAIAQGSKEAASSMNVLFAGASKAITDGPDGLITAFSRIEAKVKEYGPIAAAQVASTAGLMGSSVSDFANASESSMKKADSAFLSINGHLIPLSVILQENTSQVNKLERSWQQFSNTLAEKVIVPAESIAADILEDVNAILDKKISWSDFWSAVPSGISQVAKGAASAGTTAEVGVGNMLLGLFDAVRNAAGLTGSDPLHGTPLATPAPSSNAPIGSQTNTTINTTINMSGGNSTAGSAQLMGSAIGDKLHMLASGIGT